jgi:hypothetical protein
MLKIFISFVPSPCLMQVVFVIILCVTLTATAYALVIFHVERVNTVQYHPLSQLLRQGGWIVVDSWGQFSS